MKMLPPLAAGATLAIALSVSSVAPAAAPATAAAPQDSAAAEPACELHVFPTIEGKAMTTGLLSGFGIVGAIADAAKNKNRNASEAEYLREALGPRLQVQALKSIDMVGALKLPPSQVIWETPIADRNISTKATTRLSSSTAPCYAELLVTENFYTKRAIYGRSLNNRFIFKDFRTGKTKTNMIKGRGGNGLSQFPPKTTDETEAAEADLRSAFSKNFLEFAKGLTPAK
ncbi:hypothetical protein [Sphingomonas sp.]|uniref:hypothetical protein n=1 Tax=Sphingomonas sp. TaxID=28214 RepID=UPI002E3296C3|nr:hypothetical protein [Sphingomonas sp.]HEX4694175.1 hypothetical protein [Sphingomonas sp.]